MPAITYSEDADFGIDLDEVAISKCTDIDTLINWSDDAEAVIEDIKGQVTICALGGHAERTWVYRAGKAMGYMARAKSRIRARLLTLGWIAPHTTRELAELTRKFTEAKARYAVATEFLRLCDEGAIKDRALFSRIEKQALTLVAQREEKRIEREEARKAA